MKAKKSDVRLALVVIIDDAQLSIMGSYKSSWITAHVGQLSNSDPRGFEFVSSYGDNGAMAKIQFRELLNSERKGQQLTGTLISGDLSHCRAYEIEPVLKLMKRIDVHMERLREKFGYVQTFEGNVLRLADAIGADTIIVRNSGEQRQRSGNDYRIAGLSQGAYNVEHDIKVWFDTHAPKVETAGAQ